MGGGGAKKGKEKGIPRVRARGAEKKENFMDFRPARLPATRSASFSSEVSAASQKLGFPCFQSSHDGKRLLYVQYSTKYFELINLFSVC